MEAELKKIHEQLEMKKAAQAEKLKNSAAAVHRAAEEKRAAAVARRGEEVIAAEEAAARYRARGQAPTRLFGRGWPDHTPLLIALPPRPSRFLVLCPCLLLVFWFWHR
ncbi:remorin 1.4-like [Miscanthus floridulus]|uniref:remorin 1.4-like n=1 Tax=Miscanthus floridulus TaxID=154761 RepID=UPI003458A26E